MPGSQGDKGSWEGPELLTSGDFEICWGYIWRCYCDTEGINKQTCHLHLQRPDLHSSVCISLSHTPPPPAPPQTMPLSQRRQSLSVIYSNTIIQICDLARCHKQTAGQTSLSTTSNESRSSTLPHPDETWTPDQPDADSFHHFPWIIIFQNQRTCLTL